MKTSDIMGLKLSQRVQKSQLSPIHAFHALESHFEETGNQIIDLTIGDFDIEPPPEVTDALVHASRTYGHGYYPPAAGLDILREEISTLLARETETAWATENILVSCGARHALYLCLLALLDEGDEVIIPVPYWPAYPELVTLSGGTPVFVQTQEDHQLNLVTIERVITEKTKCIIVNSPNNPTGAVYSESTLKELIVLAIKHNIVIFSDEVYDQFIYRESRALSIVTIDPVIKSHCVVLNTVSKRWAIPGWRFGFAAGPEELIESAARLQNHISQGPASIIQLAVIDILQKKNSQVFMEQVCETYRMRRDTLVPLLQKIPNISFHPPEGACYFWLKLPTRDSMQFCKALLEKYGVALVPGIAFGQEGYARLCLSASLEKLIEAVSRLKRLIDSSNHL